MVVVALVCNRSWTAGRLFSHHSPVRMTPRMMQWTRTLTQSAQERKSAASAKIGITNPTRARSRLTRLTKKVIRVSMSWRPARLARRGQVRGDRGGGGEQPDRGDDYQHSGRGPEPVPAPQRRHV